MKARCFECKKKPARVLPNPYGEATAVFCSLRCAAHFALACWWRDFEIDQDSSPRWDAATGEWEWVEPGDDEDA
jgi:hypothetical protein